MEIHLEQFLKHPFHFYIKKKTRKLIINRIKNYNSLKIHKDTIKYFLIGKTKHGLKFINHRILISLLKVAKLKPKDIENSVVYIKRGWKNKHLKVKLPIKPSPELALLIAKTMGDGGISSDFRFHYTNNNFDLIKEVVLYVNKTIGKTENYLQFRKNKNNCYEIKFPSTVGYILMLFGAPQGYKIYNQFGIPKWIKSGSKNIKSFFVRGIFDDESSVNYSDRSRRIIFAMGKLEKYKDSLRKFLFSLKKILSEFNISSSEINLQKKYSDRIILRFVIYRKINFKNFYDQIGFTNKNKKDRLNKIINSYINIHKNKEFIYNIIKNSKNPLKVKDVSDLSKIGRDLTKYNLLDLYESGRIYRNKIKNYYIYSIKNSLI